MQQNLGKILHAYKQALFLSIALFVELLIWIRTSKYELLIIRFLNTFILFCLILIWLPALAIGHWHTFTALTLVLIYLFAEKFFSDDQHLATNFYEKFTLYLQSPDWLLKEQYVLKRDKHTCVSCGAKQHLHAYHLTFRDVFRERLHQLCTLCDDCYQKQQQKAIQNKNISNH
jgi:hypothetical protein